MFNPIFIILFAVGVVRSFQMNNIGKASAVFILAAVAIVLYQNENESSVEQHL